MNEPATSSANVKEILASCASYWQKQQKEIVRVATQIERNLAGRLHPHERASLAEKRKILGAAVQHLVDQAKSPELVIATTGTTSSGKSTLANFLIGEEILPSAVQEMSAGLVTIHHHEKRRMLKIPSTQGSRWEVGEWDDLSVKALRDRLRETMDAFREAQKDDGTIEAVRFEIHWPIRLARQHAKFGLPADTRVTIVDLPGLKAVGDERNGHVIKANISQALCLVTYNALETDDKKQKELLNQVIAQIMKIRVSSASLGRMLFLLNRVDAFAQNENAEEYLTKFARDVTNQLHAGLLDRMPEESQVIANIKPALLSSLPALRAVQAEQCALASDEQREFLDQIENDSRAMFRVGYWKRFPRDFADLSGDECRHIMLDTLYYSRANDFEDRLGEHIKANLPAIILTGPVERANEAADEFLTELDQTLTAHEERTNQEAEISKQQLNGVANDLFNIERETGELLRDIANRLKKNMSEADDGVSLQFSLEEVFDALGKQLGRPDLMNPARDFFENCVLKTLNDLASYCASALHGGRPVASPLMIGATSLAKFDAALEVLRTSPYGANLEQGGEFRSGAGAEEVKCALTEFAEQLSTLATFMTAQANESYGISVQISLQTCADLMLARLEERGKAIVDRELQNFPALPGLFGGKITLPRFKQTKLNFCSQFEEWQKVEKHATKEFRYERKIWTLYLIKHKVEAPVIVEHQINGVKVPGFGELLQSAFASGDLKPLQENFCEYMERVVDVLTGHVSDRISRIIGGYTKAIDQSMSDAESNKIGQMKQIAGDKGQIGRLRADHRNFFDWKDMVLHETGNASVADLMPLVAD
jgi:hypothetical protein